MKKNKHQLENKVALVTAGTGLIGSAIVKLLHKRGVKTYFTYYSNSQKAEELAYAGTPVRLDLNDLDALQNTFSSIIEKESSLDILVNCYGPIIYKSLTSLSSVEAIGQIQQNILPVLFACQHAGKAMKEKGWGRIVNIAAAGAEKIEPKKLTAPYYISKNGVVMLTKSFAREYAESGITVNSVSPGIMQGAPYAERGAISGAFHIPAGRKGDAEDVARVVLFLIEPESDYITGENINVDGGWSL